MHLSAILKHDLRDTPSHDLLQDNMELVQFYVGSDQNFWELPFPLYGHLAPDGWMKNTWEAMSTTNLTIKGKDITVPPRRKGDVHLMDAFIIELDAPQSDLAALQRCRLHAKAVTLSDITTACGNRIDDQAWLAKPAYSRDHVPWIPTRAPSRNDVVIWQAALRQLFLPALSVSQRLLHPLQDWENGIHSNKDWKWWRDPSVDRVYERVSDTECKIWP